MRAGTFRRTRIIGNTLHRPRRLYLCRRCQWPLSAVVGTENLCHQAIFMNHASGAVAPEDAEVVQVDDIIWQRAERRGLVQGAERTTLASAAWKTASNAVVKLA